MATREQVTRWAQALIRMHLSSEWSFAFDHARTRAGLCNYTTKTITVSKHLLNSDDDSIHQVLLHEVAHALAGSSAGHGPAWRAIADEIGYVGGRVHPEAIAQDLAPWLGVCPRGHTMRRFRKPRKISSCARCSRTYDPAFRISWARVPVSSGQKI